MQKIWTTKKERKNLTPNVLLTKKKRCRGPEPLGHFYIILSLYFKRIHLTAPNCNRKNISETKPLLGKNSKLPTIYQRYPSKILWEQKNKLQVFPQIETCYQKVYIDFVKIILPA